MNTQQTTLESEANSLRDTVRDILVVQLAAHMTAPPVTIRLTETRQRLAFAREVVTRCTDSVAMFYNDNPAAKYTTQGPNSVYISHSLLLVLTRLSTVLTSVEIVLDTCAEPLAYGIVNSTSTVEYDILSALCAQANIIATKAGNELETMPADWVSYVNTPGEAQMIMPVHDKHNTYFGDEPGEQL